MGRTKKNRSNRKQKSFPSAQARSGPIEVRPTLTATFRLRGLYFPGGILGKNDAALGIRILTAVHGTSRVLATEVKNVARRQFVQLMRACLDLKTLFLGLGDHPVVWDTISTNWTTSQAILGGDDMKLVVKTLMDGRQQWKTGDSGDPAPGELAALVDRWIAVVAQLEARGPLGQQHSTLAHRDSGVSALDMKGLQISADWPPPGFSAAETGLLADALVCPLLMGVSPAQPGDVPPLPRSLGDPVALRRYLGWVALTSHSVDNARALYIAPIAFVSGSDRRDWRRRAGHLASLFRTIKHFLEAASETFKAKPHVREFIGLLSPWFGAVFNPRSDQTFLEMPSAEESTKTFTTDRLMARLGMAIVLRRVERDGAPALQLVWFDPTVTYDHVKARFNGHPVHQFRGEVNAAVADSAGLLGLPVAERWWGGRIPTSILPGWEDDGTARVPDSVEMASGMCRLWVSGRSLPEDAEGLVALGFQMLEE